MRGRDTCVQRPLARGPHSESFFGAPLGGRAARGRYGATTSADAIVVTFAAAGIVLCVLAPALLVRATPGPAASGLWEWAAAIAVWAGAHVAWIIGRGRPNLFEFSFWIFVYIFLGLAPLVQLRAGVFPSTTPDIHVQFVGSAVTLVIAGLVSAEFGMVIGRRLYHAVTAERKPHLMSERRAMLLAIVGLAFAAYYIHRVGVGALFATRFARDTKADNLWPNLATRAIFTDGAYMPLLVAVHALVRIRRASRPGGKPRCNRWFLGVCVIALIVVVNPITSARYVSGTVALSFVLLLGGFNTARRARISLAVAVVALVFVFPYAAAFRTQNSGIQQIGIVGNLESSGDYDAFAQIVNAVDYVKSEGPTNGRQALGIVLFWVPRSLWHTKPTDTGALLAQYRGYAFNNLSAPLWAELLINGGLPLVIVGFVGLGLVVGRIGGPDLVHVDAVRNVGAGIMAFYFLIVLRGSLLQATAAAALLGASCVALRWSLPGARRSTGTGRAAALRAATAPEATSDGESE